MAQGGGTVTVTSRTGIDVLAISATFTASLRWGFLCGAGFAIVYALGRSRDA